MDMNSVLSALKKIKLKKGQAINVSTIDNELAVSIIRKKRIKRFKNINSAILLSQVSNYLQV